MYRHHDKVLDLRIIAATRLLKTARTYEQADTAYEGVYDIATDSDRLQLRELLVLAHNRIAIELREDALERYDEYQRELHDVLVEEHGGYCTL